MEHIQTFELLIYPLIKKYKQMITSRVKLEKKKRGFTKFVNKEEEIFLPN